jgi:hypothetical protein
MKRKLSLTLAVLMTTLVITSCSSLKSTNEVVDSSHTRLIENKSVYKSDEPGSVKEIYVTVMPAKDQPPKYAFTLTQLNEDISGSDDKEVEVRVLLQEGKGGVVSVGNYGHGLTSANATMKQRGQSARIKPQKSYKVTLDKASGLWNGFSVLNLNKHPFDPVRVRNKMAYDNIKNISGIPGLRTQFVHLYVRDLSQGIFSNSFQDYGLFTHVENVDTDYLKNHGLDPKGSLYKAENFEFYRYPDEIKLVDDPDYKKRDFEDRLEIKGDEDHTKLITMLDDVNNRMININTAIEKYFDRENYLTWLAINILFDNVDTSSRNFYIYSPSNSNKWYFIPWDYDKSLGGYDKYSRGLWQEGITNYWGTVLHQRFLMVKQNRDDLSKKIEELYSIFSEENMSQQIKIYQPIVNQFLSKIPDNEMGKVNIEEVQQELQNIPKLIKAKKQKHYEILERPMPVFMGQPVDFGDYCIFTWGKSHDFQDDYIKYSITISKTPDFKEKMYQKNDILDAQCPVKKSEIIKRFGKGTYYWKLGIHDSKGNYQESFDLYHDEATNEYYFGIQQFIVK